MKISYLWLLLNFIFILSSCVQKTDSSLSYSAENFPDFDFSVNGGAAKVSDVQISIQVISQRTDLKSYSISSGSTCVGNVWQELTSLIPFNLSLEEGEKSISMKVKTIYGFESRCVTKKITLDKTPSDILAVTPPNSGEYGVGQALEFKVNLKEKGKVVGTPRIKMKLGSNVKYAEYVSGSGTLTLLFRYVPVAGDEDWDGIEIQSPIETPSAQILDEPGNNLNLHFNMPALSEVLVHTSPNPYAVLTSSIGPKVFDEFQVLLRLNKVVSALDKTKFIVTNGEVTSVVLTKDASMYSLYVKPNLAGEVSVKLPADSVKDSQQLGNLASYELKVDYEIPVELSLLNDMKKVSEGNTSLPQRFLFTLSAPKPYATEVFYAVLKSSTAVYGKDHDLPLTGTVVIPVNTSSASLNYHVLGNTASEPDRILGIQILRTSSYGVQVSSNNQSHQVIKDDDSSPNLYFAVTAGAAGERESHTCALSAAGVLSCWGANSSGQLGNGNNAGSSNIPLMVDLGVSYNSISAGGGFTCGITTSKDLKCWGKNNWGQTGDSSPTKFSPAIVDNGVKFKSVSSGFEHACAITEAGSLKCWGRNNQKQLGRTRSQEVDGPGDVDSGTAYSSVAAGGYHTCGITTNNDLKCWGTRKEGSSGQTLTLISATPSAFDSAYKYSDVSSGLYHSCGIRQNGDLTCWGYNDQGQLGNNTKIESSNPVLIDAGEKYKKVFLGQNHSCGITTSNKLKCWGGNGAGVLGDGTSLERLTPTFIDINEEYSQIGAALEHSCGLTTGQVLNCWGYNFLGELGSGMTATVQEPTVVQTPIKFSKISVGKSHGCGISMAGELYCFGDLKGIFEFGESPLLAFPVLLDPGTLYSQISVGWDVNCGITQAGILKCWGWNGTMILGDGTLNRRRYPVVVDAGTLYSKVSVGEEHACGITTAGVLKCWGSNNFGAIGVSGISLNDKTPPVRVVPDTEFTELTSGDFHNCAITKAGELGCWGYNGFGGIGDGTKTTWAVPKLIESGVTYKFIHAGRQSTCGITIAGDLKCWGANNFNVLGDGSTSEQLRPVVIDSGVKYSRVSVGDTHACGITQAGRVKCWGGDHLGQLGNSLLGNSSTPQEISDASLYQEIEAGNMKTCGLTQSGVIKCWGALPSKLGQGVPNNQLPWPVIPR